MDWMTFVVELIKALAWPVVAVTVIFVFKDKLTKLFEDITELKGLDIEAKFARGAKEVLEEVKVIEAVEAEFDPNAPIDDPVLAKIQPIGRLLVVASPQSAVLLARTNIESAVKRLVVREGTLTKGGVNVMSALQQLRTDRVISSSIHKTALELIQLANKAAHNEFVPSVDAAQDFVDASDKLIKLLLRPLRSRSSDE